MMWFRGLLITLNVLMWGLCVKLVLHSSLDPAFLGRYSSRRLVLIVLVLGAALASTLIHLAPVYERVYRKRFQLVWALLVSPILGLLLAEGLMRGFNLFGSQFYTEVGRYMRVLVPDVRAVYRNPSGHREVYQGVEITTNEFGFRNRPLSPKLPDRRRILVLGDSVTFGWGVRAEEAFCSRLEGDLRRRGFNVETINTGVSGYNTYQELMVLKGYGEILKPELVLLVYVDNDIEIESDPLSQIRPISRPWRDPLGTIRHVVRKSRIYSMVYQLWPVFVSPVRPTQARDSQGWQRSMESLAEIAAYCRTRRIPFATFHFRMTPNPVSDDLNRGISVIANREHFYFCDMLPWFEHRNIFRLVNSYLDSHPNAEGHQLIADGMARSLVDTPGLLLQSSTSTAQKPEAH